MCQDELENSTNLHCCYHPLYDGDSNVCECQLYAEEMEEELAKLRKKEIEEMEFCDCCEAPQGEGMCPYCTGEIKNELK